MKRLIPKSSITQNEKEYTIYCEIPGVTKENLSIEIEEDRDVLSLKAPFLCPKEKDMKTVYAEFQSEATWERRFVMGSKIDKTTIQAKLEDGLLTITLPRTKQVIGKKIDVK